MTARQLIVSELKRSTDALFERARAVPSDKIEWRPLDEGRSVLDQCQECALSPTWSTELLRTRKFPDFTPELMAEFQSKKAAMKSLEECEAVVKQNLDTLIAAIEGFPDSDLEQTIWLPFGKKNDWSIYDVMMLHSWNCTYHTGQINYIQTLYGDKAM